MTLHDRLNFQKSTETQSTVEVQIDMNALRNRKNSITDEAIRRTIMTRKNEERLRQAYLNCTQQFIENNDNDVGLLQFLQEHAQDLSVLDMLGSNGKTLLHECTFHDSPKCAKAIMNLAKYQTQTAQILTDWINKKEVDDGFTSLHFASWKGNVDLMELLVDNGADLNLRNNHGINVLHVAAQGDKPISIYFFKLRGLDLRSKDNRDSTPLHWAAYAMSEVTLVYLLSWLDFYDDQDC